MSSQLKTIATFAMPEDAEVARLALQEEDITSFLENATTIGMVSWWGNAVGWVKLQVSGADEDRARAILAQKRVGPDTHTCSKCGASLPPNFDVCWSCQTPVGVEGNVLSGAQSEDGNGEEETTAGDAMAWRACIGAMFGFASCLLLNAYSVWLILQLALGDYPLSKKGNRNFRWAVFINLAVAFLLGLIAGHW